LAARKKKEKVDAVQAAPPPASSSEKSGLLICPECSDPFQNARNLGQHRWHRHGVVSPVKLKAMAQAEQKQLQPTERMQPVNDKKLRSTSHSGAVEGGNHAAAVASLDPIAYALAIGSIKEFCRHFAEEHGNPYA